MVPFWARFISPGGSNLSLLGGSGELSKQVYTGLLRLLDPPNGDVELNHESSNNPLHLDPQFLISPNALIRHHQDVGNCKRYRAPASAVGVHTKSTHTEGALEGLGHRGADLPGCEQAYYNPLYNLNI